MRPRAHGLALLLILLLSATPTLADALTEAQVRGTVAALQELEAAFGRNPERGGAQSGLPPLATGQADAEEARSILRRHGFASIEAWTEISRRVVNAYMAVKFADEQPDAAAEMARARAEIEASDLGPEQKRQMLATLEQSLAAMRSMADAPPEDVVTVRRLLPYLDAYFAAQ